MANLRFWQREFWQQPPTKTPAPLLLLVDGKGEPLSLAHAREQLATRPKLGIERGASGTPRMGDFITEGDEYNRDLSGKNAIKAFDRMRRSDGQVKAVLDLIKLPLMGAEWRIEPPDDGDPTDEEIAEFCHHVLIDDDGMVDSWHFTLRHILLMLDFGFSVFEKVWDVGPENRLVLHRLAPRLPQSIESWEVDDETGRLISVVQRAYKNGSQREIAIPAEECAVFVHDREGDNYNGRSVLRPLYKHFHYKERLYTYDAVGHERLSVGIPMAELDESAEQSPTALDAIAGVLTGIRAHDQGFLIAPPGVRFKLLQTQTSNTSLMTSIEHHDVMIARGILAPFLNVGQAPHGTRSSTESLVDVFFNSLEGIAAEIQGEVKKQILKPLCDLNWPMEGRQYPTLALRNLRKPDLDLLSMALERVTRAKVLTVDDGVENAFREIMGWPPLAEELSRENRPPMPVPPAFGNGNGTPPEVPGMARSEEEPIAASARRHYGDLRLREPNPFERQVMSFSEIPTRLDREIDALIADLAAIRQEQVRAAAKYLVAIDAQSPANRPMSALDPKHFALPLTRDVEKAIRQAQARVMEYGAQQVRLELRRQGMPVDLALDLDDVLRLAEEPIVAEGVITKRAIRDQLAASARSLAEGINTQLRTLLMTEAVRLRRSGLTGNDLRNALEQVASQAAKRNVATPARGEVHEAFSLGRTAEQSRHRDQIAYMVYSALLDSATCSFCANVDGHTFAYGSADHARYTVPNVDCRGRDACRCVLLAVYAGGGT